VTADVVFADARTAVVGDPDRTATSPPQAATANTTITATTDFTTGP
jgi:hypothetical protein